MTDPIAGVNATRRGILGLFAAGAAVTATGGLLTGCSEPTNSGKGKAEQESGLSKLLPTYTAFEVVKPDLPGGAGGTPPAPGFTRYPTKLVRAVQEKPVKSGKEVTVMTPLWGPLPPTSGNSFFAANAERIGAPVKFNIVNGVDYLDKLNAILGASDVPEMISIPAWNSDSIARFSEATDNLFEDLTPFLSGNNASAYPLLANLPTRAWAYGVWNGMLKGVPFPSDYFPQAFLYRKDILDAAGLAEPKNIDELFELGKKLTNPAANRWAFGDINLEVRRAYRVPTEWSKGSDGKLINALETPEFEQALIFMRRVYEAGFVHPTVLANKSTDNKPLLESGQMVMDDDGPGAWAEMARRQLSVNPQFKMAAVTPFAADGGRAVVAPNNPANIFTYVKKGLGKERTQELLGVLNYTAAPFGTEEFQLYNYGVEGRHYTRDANGAPQKTGLGSQEVAETFMFLGGRPAAITSSEIPDYVPTMHKWQATAAPLLQKNPFDGIRVQRPQKLSAITTPTDDKIQDILRGRRPASDLKQVVQEWRQGGGDEARDFYAKVLSDNGR